MTDCSALRPGTFLFEPKRQVLWVVLRYVEEKDHWEARSAASGVGQLTRHMLTHGAPEKFVILSREEAFNQVILEPERIRDALIEDIPPDFPPRYIDRVWSFPIFMALCEENGWI